MSPSTPDAGVLLALLDALPARVVVLDRALAFRFVNREFLSFTGLSADEVVGRSVREVMGELVWQGLLPVAERLFDGETVRWDGWIDYPGRGRRYVQEHLLPLPAGDGGERVVVAFGRDLTELKRREKELAERLRALETSEALKSAIVDHALAAIVTADEDGAIVEWNPAAERIFGLRRELALGRLVSDTIIPPRHRAGHEAGMARLKAGAPHRVIGRRLEMHALAADGREFPMEMVLSETLAHGRRYYTAFIVDTTERQRAAEEIARQREALRQSEKLGAMGSLLAGVAHELNNPLAVVMARASLLEERCVDDAALRHDALRIREAADRCGRIVRAFLNMARARPGERRPVSLNDLARAAAELLSYGMRSHGIALSLALDAALPPVAADGDQLGQVVLNLLVNAQQALAELPPPAPRRIELATGRDPGEAAVWLRVSDTGPGVPDALREQVFTPFFTTKSEGSGTGLGLAVSRGIARDHGGTLELRPGAGGACFELRVPLAPGAPPTAAPAFEPPAPVEAVGRLLVVDDEPELADTMREMLERAGYEVAAAESGAVALALLAEARFDAVVSDLRMPDMDGAGLWQAILERHPRLARRVLFVTGDTLSPAAQRFLAEARCPTLDKPFSGAALLDKVRALLRG